MRKKIKKYLLGDWPVSKKQMLFGSIPLVLLLNIQLGMAFVGIVRVEKLIAYVPFLIFLFLVGYTNISLAQEIMEELRK